MDARIFGITSLIFLSAWLRPAEIESVDFRSLNTANTIVTDKASPAIAALEDSRTVFLQSPTEFNEATPDRLKLVSIYQPINSDKKKDQPRTLRAAIITQEVKTDYLAKLISSTLEDPPPPTVTELAEVLVKEELARRQNALASNGAGANIREIETAAGKNIIVSKPVLINAARFLKKSTPAVTLPETAAVSPSAPNFRRTISSNRTSKPARYVISGPLTFAGGTAFLGMRNSITTGQLMDGLLVATGTVNIREASYEIAVDDLDGELLGEVRNQDGQIMGQGRVDLKIFGEKYSRQARLKDIALEVRPVFNGTSGTTISAASYGKNKYLISEAKVYVAGLSREIALNKKTQTYEDDTLAMPSTYILRGAHDNFWPTLSFGESGEKFQLRLFPTGLIDALLSLALNKYEAREAKSEAVIWGRISLLGRPIEGAKVQIVGEIKNTANYFTGYIPDKTKNSTTSRGEFAFTRVTGSEAMVRVSLNNKLMLPTMLPIESRHVTYADLEIEAARNIEIKSYDAFSEAPLETALQPLGTKDNIYISPSGVSRVQLDTVKGITLIESDAGEPYVVSRVALKTGQTEMHFPQIKKEWLEALLTKSSSAQKSANQSASVTFINGDNYDVIIGDGGNEMNPDIIYFDASGDLVASRHGVSGGGFVVFGLPRGLNTITVMPERSKKVVTQVIYVDEYATNISRINLMF